MNDQVLQTVKSISEIGLTGMLLYFLTVVWSDKKKKDSDYDERIKERYQHMRDMNENILDVVKENTKTQQEVRNAIDSNTKVIESNTRAQETLTSKINDVLARR